jgi:hypothetical protein
MSKLFEILSKSVLGFRVVRKTIIPNGSVVPACATPSAPGLAAGPGSQLAEDRRVGDLLVAGKQ